MLRPTVLLAAAGLCVAACGCKRPDFIRLQPTIEEPPTLSSNVRVGDPTASSQFIRGFYAIEGNSWRWTAPRFAVALGVPPSGPRYGSWLVLKFTVHEKSIEALKSLTLTANVGGVDLAAETYTTPGEKQYRREVPASVLNKDVVDASFVLDKYLKLPGDGRELGVIAQSVGLESK